MAPEDSERSEAEDYYKRIHAHRTVLAMQAVRPNAHAGAVLLEEDAPTGAQALLLRVFAAEKESAVLAEQLVEARYERDAARDEVVVLRRALDAIRALAG